MMISLSREGEHSFDRQSMGEASNADVEGYFSDDAQFVTSPMKSKASKSNSVSQKNRKLLSAMTLKESIEKSKVSGPLTYC